MAGTDDTRIELTGAIYECEVLAATVVVAVEALQNLPASSGITAELAVVLRLAKQMDEAVDRVTALLREHFKSATQ